MADFKITLICASIICMIMQLHGFVLFSQLYRRKQENIYKSLLLHQKSIYRRFLRSLSFTLNVITKKSNINTFFSFIRITGTNRFLFIYTIDYFFLILYTFSIEDVFIYIYNRLFFSYFIYIFNRRLSLFKFCLQIASHLNEMKWLHGWKLCRNNLNHLTWVRYVKRFGVSHLSELPHLSEGI